MSGGGPLIADVEGLELGPADRDLLAHPAVCGVVLFARNYSDREQLGCLVADIKALRDPPLLVTVDQEGGRVQRFVEGFTRLPALARLGEAYQEDAERGLALARSQGWVLASELRCAGVDLSYAPVLDLRSHLSSVIGERAFDAEPTVVVALATAMSHGMREAGMACVGKHFPGHGSVSGDSHHGLPVDGRDFEQLWAEDLSVFAALIQAHIPALMMGHVLYPKMDERPACFSPWWVNGHLRESLGYRGLVFTDDLSMGAADAVAPLPDRALLALDAGCDFVLVCNDPAKAAATADVLADRITPERARRVAELLPRGRRPDWDHLVAMARYQSAHRDLEALV